MANKDIVEEISLSLDQVDALLIVLTQSNQVMRDNLGKFNEGGAQSHFIGLGYSIQDAIKEAKNWRVLTQSVVEELPGILELLTEVRPILEDRSEPKIQEPAWKKKP